MQKYQHVRILNMQNIATCKINNMHVALTTCIFNLPPIKQAFLATVHVDMQKSVEKFMSTWRPFFLMNPGPACQCCFYTVLYTIRKLQPAILLVLLSVANTWISGGLCRSGRAARPMSKRPSGRRPRSDGGSGTRACASRERSERHAVSMYFMFRTLHNKINSTAHRATTGLQFLVLLNTQVRTLQHVCPNQRLLVLEITPRLIHIFPM